MIIGLRNAISVTHVTLQLYILWFKLVLERLGPDREGCEFIDSYDASTFVCHMEYRSSNRHRSLQGGRCVSSWWHLVWLGYLRELCVYTIYIWMGGWWGMPFVFRCLIDGGRDGLWWPAFSGHWLFCAVCWQCLLSMKWLMFGILFLHLSTSLWCFCPRISFLNNGFD